MNSLALAGELPEQARECLQIAEESGASLTELLDDVLDLSRIEAGRMELDYRPFSVQATIEEAARTLSATAIEKRLTLTTTVDSSVPSRLSGDAIRLRQVLLNLLSNAIRFTDNGRIHVGAKAIGKGPGAVVVEFRVANTGAGVAPDQCQAILEALRLAPDFAGLPSPAIGLSLGISSHLVKLMRGAISVESEPGHGSCFRFTAQFLPVAEETPAPVDAEATARSLVNLALAGQNKPNPARPLEILIAEDNAVNQKLAIRILEDRGCRVVAANNGAQALALLAEKSFDLILMDVQMPAIDGLEATRAIRMKERQSGAHIPIVALTAHAMSGDESRCREAGMDGYLAKPVRREDLVRVVERFAGRSTATASLARTAL